MKHRVSYSFSDYRQAAAILWGEAGAWAVDEDQRRNVRYCVSVRRIAFLTAIAYPIRAEGAIDGRQRLVTGQREVGGQFRGHFLLPLPAVSVTLAECPM